MAIICHVNFETGDRVFSYDKNPDYICDGNYVKLIKDGNTVLIHPDDIKCINAHLDHNVKICEPDEYPTMFSKKFFDACNE